MSLACTIDASGITAPSYPEILAALKTAYRGIYGQDVYLEPDSQDGQWLAVIAAAFNDVNNTTIAVYNAQSPASAQGAGLSSVVKINGLQREIPTNSTTDLTIVGQAGTTITNGIAGDDFGAQFALPATVLIPIGGQVIVTATCTEAGAVTALAGTITRIITPTRGWQSVTNAADATVGAPVESDPALRDRQANSTALPSRTVLEGIVGSVGNLPGVQSIRPYVNTSATTDANGLPRNSFCLVVQGGDVNDIATTIAQKKSEGSGTYGNTAVTVFDKNGVPATIAFQRPTITRVICQITMKVRSGYISTTGDAMIAATCDYVNGLKASNGIDLSKVESAANLNNGRLSRTFNIQGVELARFGSPLAADDLNLDFDEIGSLAPADVTLVVVS